MPLGEVKRVIKCAVSFKIKRIKHRTRTMNTICCILSITSQPITFFIIDKFYKLQENRKKSHIDTHDLLFSSFARNFAKTWKFFVKPRARFKRNIGLATKWLRTLLIPPNDKIRNDLIANIIIAELWQDKRRKIFCLLHSHFIILLCTQIGAT